MTYEQVQILEEKTRKMHHEFANILISIDVVRENFDTWSPERKATHEARWKTAYMEASASLSICLAIFDT